MNTRVPPKSAHPMLRHLRYHLDSRLPRLYPGAICRISADDAIAITIDDGPSGATRELLEALREEALLATFFLSGTAVLERPQLVRAIRGAGHALGSHGYRHEDLSRLATDRVADDIHRGIDALSSVDGERPALFRPPYGRLHPRHRGIVSALGCRFVLWSSMPGDFDPSIPVRELFRRIDRLRAGDIVVFHDREESVDRTVSCIHHLGVLLRDRGMRAATL